MSVTSIDLCGRWPFPIEPNPRDYEKAYMLFVIRTHETCIGLLKRGGFAHCSFAPCISLFSSWMCSFDIEKRYQWCEQIAEPTEDSLGVAAFVLFQEKVQPLHNHFIPSGALQKGFEFRYQNFTVRGHERHFEATQTALSDIDSKFDRLLTHSSIQPFQEMETLRQNLEVLMRDLRTAQAVLTRDVFNPITLRQRIQSQFRGLRETAERITRLQLLESGERIKGQIQEARASFSKTVVMLRQLVNDAYFGPAISSKEVDAIEKTQLLLSRQFPVLREIAISEEDTKRKTILQREWECLFDQLEGVAIGKGVSSTQAAIMRVTHDLPLVELEQLWIAIYHSLSKFIEVSETHLTRYNAEYFRDPTLREDFLKLLEKECLFFDFPKGCQENLQKLKDHHQFWCKWSTIKQKSCANTHEIAYEKEILWGFQNLLRGNLSSLSYQLIHPNSLERCEEKVCLLLERVSLIDQYLNYLKEKVEGESSIHYIDFQYGHARKLFDEHLFLLCSGVLVKWQANPHPHNDHVAVLDQCVCDLMRKERLYTPLKDRAGFVTMEKKVSDFADILIDQIEDLKRLSSDMGIPCSHLDSLSQAFAMKSTSFDEATEELQRCMRQPKKENFQVVVMRVHREKDELDRILSQIHDALFEHTWELESLDAALKVKKERLKERLMTLCFILPKRNPLAKAITTFQPSLHSEIAAKQMNRALLEAQQTVKRLEDNLTTLRKGTTKTDRDIRDRAVEKLEEVMQVFDSDPRKHFYDRCLGLRSAFGNKEAVDQEAYLTQLREVFESDEAQALVQKVPSFDSTETLSTELQHVCQELTPSPDELFTDSAEKQHAFLYRVRQAWEVWERRLALNLLEEIMKDVARSTFCERRQKFQEHREKFQLQIYQREWYTQKNEQKVSFGWRGQPLREDPLYKDDDTHIPISRASV